jgi:(E)-4-hydroxy-3-methylbut-2-enyl-diphosphate synthase
MFQIKRRKTRIIRIGNVRVGGDYPVAIQSMAKTKTSDVEKTVRQIRGLESAGCEIVRLAVKDNSDTKAIAAIKKRVKIPLVADIHFDWRLALTAINNGVDKIRLNPGNIYKKDQIREIVKAASQARIPIRVGLNSGSLRSHQSTRAPEHQSTRTPEHQRTRAPAHQSQAQKMVRSAVDYIKILEGFHFYDIVISLKAQNVLDTVEAYRLMAKFCDYPFHLGVTATGLSFEGLIKSSAAIGALLLEGIGDTIRVSLTDEPRNEVRVARCLLESLGLRQSGLEIISCPTCGRCEVDLVRIVKELEKRLSMVHGPWSTDRSFQQPLKIAVMGCVVNGPGEARQADLGIAFGKKEGLFFKKGKAVKKVSADKCVSVLMEEIGKLNSKL